MKHAAVGVVMAMILCGAAPGAQQPEKSSDPFNGKWRLNVEKTKLMSGGEALASEVTTFTIGADGVQHYHVQFQREPNGPVTTGTYATKYNEFKWVPYINPATGKATLDVMTIKVDERTHYRIARGLDGTAQYVMMRRLTEDHKAYLAYGLTVDGKMTLWRYFDRIE